METAEKVLILPAAWSDDAAQCLNGTGDVADYARQVAGGADLFRVERGGGRVGYFLLRVDKPAAGLEGVVVAAAGYADFDLTGGLLPAIEQHFAGRGCRSLRIHTRRPGLVRKLAAAGYGGMEMVMRKTL